MSLEMALSIAGVLIASLCTLAMALLKWNVERTLKDFDHKFEASNDADTHNEDESKALTDKVHKLELSNATMLGDLRLLQAQHGTLLSDLKEIESKMVTRDEFRSYMKQLDQNIAIILQRTDARSYARPTPGTMPAVKEDDERSVRPRR